MELSSTAFFAGEPIPRRYACEGEDRSPPLRWTEVPPDAASLALIVDDPDAPVGTFTHWVARGIDPGAGGRGEGERAPREGRNDFGQTRYRGRCPPRGHGQHRYSFRVYALASEPAVRAEARRMDLEGALGGNVLAVAELVGTFER
jgi:Raf kinase inhibitor-like YbhB/YbcL family protein